VEFRADVNNEETSHGAIPYDRSMSRIDTVPACDGQRDRQTDGFT